MSAWARAKRDPGPDTPPSRPAEDHQPKPTPDPGPWPYPAEEERR